MKPGMTACARIRRQLAVLIRGRPTAKVSIIWCPSKAEVGGMTQVDAEAKAAARLQQIINTPPNPTSVRARIQVQLKAAANAPPFLRHLETPDGGAKPSGNSQSPEPNYRAQRPPSLPRYVRDTVLLMPTFNVSRLPTHPGENFDQFLTVCRRYAGLCKNLFAEARKTKTPTNQTSLLTDPEMYKALSEFGRKTFRFFEARYRIQSRPQPRTNQAQNAP